MTEAQQWFVVMFVCTMLAMVDALAHDKRYMLYVGLVFNLATVIAAGAVLWEWTPKP